MLVDGKVVSASTRSQTRRFIHVGECTERLLSACLHARFTQIFACTVHLYYSIVFINSLIKSGRVISDMSVLHRIAELQAAAQQVTVTPAASQRDGAFTASGNFPLSVLGT